MLACWLIAGCLSIHDLAALCQQSLEAYQRDRTNAHIEADIERYCLNDRMFGSLPREMRT